jgi:hypothetical protein
MMMMMMMVMVIINCTQQSDVLVTLVLGSYGVNLPLKFRVPLGIFSVVYFGPSRLRLGIEPREDHGHLLPYPGQLKLL